jgi:hypothetical protein
MSGDQRDRAGRVLDFGQPTASPDPPATLVALIVLLLVDAGEWLLGAAAREQRDQVLQAWCHAPMLSQPCQECTDLPRRGVTQDDQLAWGGQRCRHPCVDVPKICDCETRDSDRVGGAPSGGALSRR